MGIFHDQNKMKNMGKLETGRGSVLNKEIIQFLTDTTAESENRVIFLYIKIIF